MEKTKTNPKLTAILQALLVTFLWSTSWVLIKFGLEDIPALTFAGIRYFFAFLVLLPVYLRSKQTIPINKFNKRDWFILVIYGLVYCTLTQGTNFLALANLPAITLSLLLNFSAPIVALLSIPFLKEHLTWQQWLGIGVFLVGVYVFFYPVDIPPDLILGLVFGMVSVLATSVSSIFGRFINRVGRLDALTVTVVSMGIGSVVLLGIGLVAEEAPTMDWQGWVIVLWLAVVNSAFAFTLWNHTLRTLSAAESSIINNTMLVQIAILAWLFLGEEPTGMEILGMAVVLAGVILVNLRWRKNKMKTNIYPQDPAAWRLAIQEGIGLDEGEGRKAYQAREFPYGQLEQWIKETFSEGFVPDFVPALLRNIKGLVAWAYGGGQEPSWPGCDDEADPA